MRSIGAILGMVALVAAGSGCSLWWLPEGEPPSDGIVDNTPPSEYSLVGAVNRMATALIVKAAQNGCSGVPVGVRGDPIVLPVWQQAGKALNWKSAGADAEWLLDSVREKNLWRVCLFHNGAAVWQDRVTLREEEKTNAE